MLLSLSTGNREGRHGMRIALANGERRTAEPGGRASCPRCGAPVRAQCGDVYAWHWAHVAGEDCDAWSEPETAWHAGWKAAAPLDRQEVTMGAHRADVVAGDGVVCELQHSPISSRDIAARESHYGEDMRWLFDATGKGLELEPMDFPAAHRWKAHRPHRWPGIGLTTRRVMLDFGPDVGVLSCEKINESGSYMWGYMYPHFVIRMWLAGPEFWAVSCDMI